MGICSRSVMNGSSSRKTPLSLMHLGGNQREVEIGAVGERATNVGADEQAGGRRRRTEQRVLDDDQLESTRRSRSADCSSSSGMSGAIDTPVTTPMLLALEARQRRRARRHAHAKRATAPTPFSICGKSP